MNFLKGKYNKLYLKLAINLITNISLHFQYKPPFKKL